jgi:hypothetical protein
MWNVEAFDHKNAQTFSSVSFNKAVYRYNSTNLSSKFCKQHIIPRVHKSRMPGRRGD